MAFPPNPIPTPPPAELTQEEKVYAGLAHALMIARWWIGRSSSFLSRGVPDSSVLHALQALFWQIIFALLYVCGMILMFAIAFGTTASMPQQKTADAQFPALFVVMPFFWLIMMGGFATPLTLGIIYRLKAMRGEWAGHPIIGRWANRQKLKWYSDPL
jgi:uncharacterized membrane protein